MTLSPQQIAARVLRGVEISDYAFDRHLDERLRGVSDRFWSPAPVVARAAQWLRERGCRNVIDVGSGPGKFCVLAALSSPELRFVGVEQREALVVAARSLAVRFEVEDRVTFTHGRFDAEAAREADALYLYNPFGENVYSRDERLDETVELSAQRRQDDLRITELALDRLRVGALLITYHGFGGDVPDSFELARQEPIETDVLRLWVKTSMTPAAYVWVETGVSVVGVARRTRYDR